MASIRARVNLKVGRESNISAEIVSFNGLEKNKEHIALVFKKVDRYKKTPLVRIHSECLTGDVFHSSLCDCGEQLNESINLMSKAGGVILYLRQEGRGIGLYNKIDAYVLQHKGMNTYEANKELGFKDDLRSFDDAIKMLNALNISKVELITNNPKKISAFQNSNIDLINVRPTLVYLKKDNKKYLQTKVSQGFHKIEL